MRFKSFEQIKNPLEKEDFLFFLFCLKVTIFSSMRQCNYSGLVCTIKIAAALPLLINCYSAGRNFNNTDTYCVLKQYRICKKYCCRVIEKHYDIIEYSAKSYRAAVIRVTQRGV